MSGIQKLTEAYIHTVINTRERREPSRYHKDTGEMEVELKALRRDCGASRYQTPGDNPSRDHREIIARLSSSDKEIAIASRDARDERLSRDAFQFSDIQTSRAANSQRMMISGCRSGLQSWAHGLMPRGRLSRDAIASTGASQCFCRCHSCSREIACKYKRIARAFEPVALLMCFSYVSRTCVGFIQKCETLMPCDSSSSVSVLSGALAPLPMALRAGPRGLALTRSDYLRPDRFITGCTAFMSQLDCVVIDG